MKDKDQEKFVEQQKAIKAAHSRRVLAKREKEATKDEAKKK